MLTQARTLAGARQRQLFLLSNTDQSQPKKTIPTTPDLDISLNMSNSKKLKDKLAKSRKGITTPISINYRDIAYNKPIISYKSDNIRKSRQNSTAAMGKSNKCRISPNREHLDDQEPEHISRKNTNTENEKHSGKCSTY